MKRKSIEIICAVMFVLLLPFAAVSVSLTVQGYLYPEKVATFLGVGPLIVDSNSMEPAFVIDDLLLVKSVDAATLRELDVIAFYDFNGTVISHRIIGIEADEAGGTRFIMKGDANNVEDRDPVPAENVVGVLAKVYPGGGAVMRFIGQPWMAGLAIAVPLGLYFCASKITQALARKKEKEVTPGTDEPYPL